MTAQRPKRPNIEDASAAAIWGNFLKARLGDEMEAVEPAAQEWWELSEPGALRFGVTAGGRTFAPVLTGQGHWADQATALHIVRNQPARAREALLAKQMLLGVLERCAQTGDPLTGALLDVVRQFAAPFIDHPDHPDYEPPEAP